MNLIAAAIIGIAVIVLLIAACKVHPFLSLLAGSFVMAVCAGVPFDKAFDSFTSGVGGTISGSAPAGARKLRQNMYSRTITTTAPSPAINASCGGGTRAGSPGSNCSAGVGRRRSSARSS